MRNNTRCRKFVWVLLFLPFLCTASGCEVYDWLVSYVQRAFSSAHDYDVSVVDCKQIQKPGAIFKIDSKLSAKLNGAVRQGVRDVGRSQKYRNITLTDAIPTNRFVIFQNRFFAEDISYSERTEYLRQCCEKYNTNIIICGATMGDDYEIAFIGWLYRRDLDILTETDPTLLKANSSERVNEKIVQDSIRDLLERSLDENPIGMGGHVAGFLSDNKEEILQASGAVLTRMLFIPLFRR